MIRLKLVLFLNLNQNQDKIIFRCTNIGNYLVLRNFHPTFSLFLQYYVLVCVCVCVCVYVYTVWYAAILCPAPWTYLNYLTESGFLEFLTY